MNEINDLKQQVGNLKANLEKVRRAKNRLQRELDAKTKEFEDYKRKVEYVYSSVFDTVRIIEGIEE